MATRSQKPEGLAPALRGVVRGVEGALGQVIARADGQKVFDAVEAVRLDMVAVREGKTRRLASARRRLSHLSLAKRTLVERRLRNIITRNRKRSQRTHSPGAASSRFTTGQHRGLRARRLLLNAAGYPIRSEAAFAKLCGGCPIPASSGRTTGRHRLYRGGHRQANAALYRAVIVRMQYHQPTQDYVVRRTSDGRTKREIIRCLKRFLAREIYQRVMTDFRVRLDVPHAA